MGTTVLIILIVLVVLYVLGLPLARWLPRQKFFNAFLEKFSENGKEE